MKNEKEMYISKYNIFMWPIRNLIKILTVSFILIVVVMLVVYLFTHAEGVSIWGLVPIFVMMLGTIIFIILIPGSFHSYVTLFLLHRQEKYLHVNFEQELAGKKMKGSSYEAMYEDKDWFICYGGSYVNVFHKRYIKEISDVTKTTYIRKISIFAEDGKECEFVLSNMYGKNISKFKSWCNRGNTDTMDAKKRY